MFLFNLLYLEVLDYWVIHMKRIRITVIRKVCHKDLMEKYENPMEHACDMEEGQGCVLPHGTRCVSLSSRWPEVKVTSMTGG